MSEVYIRSQNKEKLYRLGGNYACVEYGEYEDIYGTWHTLRTGKSIISERNIQR